MRDALLSVEGVETYYGNIRALGGVDVEYKGAKVPAPDNRRSYS